MRNFSFRQFSSVFILFLFIQIAHSQEWTEQMMNSKDNNFFETQKSFEQYWEGRDIPKGKGFKPFKRWENYWQHRVLKDGSFPAAGFAQAEYEKYLRNQNNDNQRRSVTANWISEGPSTSPGGYAGIGRINCLGFHPTDTNIIYAGSAGGGLWQSNDEGSTWFTNTDDQGSLGVSGIVVDAIDPNIVYIATGDGDASDNYSVGVLKSLDGGATFNTTGLNWTVNNGDLIRRLIADPYDNTKLLAATTNGVYVSTDSGDTWTLEVTGNFYDVEPRYNNGSNTFYACTSDDIYRSTNGGDTWSVTETFSGVNRTAIATSPDNDNYVYALCSSSSNSGFGSLQRSTNNGSSFTSQSTSPNIMGWSATGSDTGGQGWYDLALAADPNDAEVIFVGGVNTWKSTDGGSNWTIKSHWAGGGGNQAVHADKHVLEFRDTDIWEGNDGGVYLSTDDGDSWDWRGNGMIISQLYKLGVAQQDLSVICGLQDNGTKLKSDNGTWSDEVGGDGMECAIKPSDSDVIYASLYYGDFRRTTNGGSSWTDIQNNIPGTPSGAWVTPFTIDSTNNSTIYIGMKDVYKSTDQGNNWTQISTNLTGGNNLSYLVIAPSDSDYIYAGRSNNLWRTTDGGTTWNTMNTPGGGTVSLTIHPTDPNTLWATRSNYSAGNKVYKSINGGSTWTNESGTLPNIPANTIIYQSGSANGLYVGMDIGVYYKDDGLSDWELFSDGMPNVEITELDINYADGFIYASTYGRGLWRSELRDQVPSCFYPLSGMIDEIGLGTATVSWIDPTTPPSNGYEYIISNSATPMGTGTPATQNTVTITGMNYNLDYYVHVRSDCASDGLSGWITIGPIKSLPSCGDTFYDAGGPTGNYSNNQNNITQLCPQDSIDKVVATFTSFDVESDWDAMYVFDGPDITYPKIASSNPVTDAGFPAGGYYGSAIPGPFESTHSSGCLTIQLLTDTYVTGAGWTTDLTCELNCSPPVLKTTADTGYGSLRHVIACPLTAAIAVDAGLMGDTIVITSNTLDVWQDVMIDQVLADKVIIKSELSGVSLFNVQSGQTLHLDNVEILMPSGEEVMNNLGTIEVQECTIKGSNVKVTNAGTINVLLNGNLNIIEE